MILNTIINDDILNGFKLIEDNSIDLMLTSPPYNIGIEYDVWDDKMDWDEYYLWCEKWIKETYRVLKPDGRMCIDHYLSLGTSKFRTSPISELNYISRKIGFNHHSIAVWTDITLAKRTAWGSWLSASAPYINSPFEGILIMYKDQWKKLNKGESDIEKEDFVKLTRGRWEFKTETRGLTKANFSVDFATKIIKLLTYKGDTVLDCFMGSGTTGLACKNNGRNYIGIEISKNYCDIANKRINNI